MPNMANIVVKKSDNTTNYTFAALSASPGDGGFAQWRGEGATPALASTLRVKSQWNGKRTARQVEVSGGVPKVETVAGISTVTAVYPFRASVTIPLNLTNIEAADAAAIMVNALSSVLFKDVLATGFAPT